MEFLPSGMRKAILCATAAYFHRQVLIRARSTMARLRTDPPNRRPPMQARIKAPTGSATTTGWTQAYSVAASGALPPDHCSFGGSANDRTAALDAVRRLNRNYSNAAGVYRQIVMKRHRIEVAVDSAEIGEIGPASSEGIQAPAGRRCIRYAGQRSNNCNGCDLCEMRHALIPKKENVPTMSSVGRTIDCCRRVRQANAITCDGRIGRTEPIQTGVEIVFERILSPA